ncbi:MAG: S49 family peptidase [Gammaproteobacteria bacterium]
MTAPNDENKTPDGGGDAFVREFARQAFLEQRRARRWGIFFKFLLFGYLLVLLLMSAGGKWWHGSISARHTALVEVKGIISDETEASADHVVAGLRAAFEDEKSVAVIIRINSPGGSPVQAGYINDEIVRLRQANPKVPVYAVITDICASGGYYIAAAADKIFADKASLVGSIGVRMDGFGFVDAIGKLGVERRLLTAGEHKGLLDPFLPVDPDEQEHVERMLEQIHQQFINTVLRGRRERLAKNDAIYSGLIWTGEKAIELGLVDELGSASYVAREVVGAEEIVDFTVREDYLAQIGRRLGTTLFESLIAPARLR